MLKFHTECWNPEKSHSKASVFFAVSKQIPVVYSAVRGRAEIKHVKIAHLDVFVPYINIKRFLYNGALYIVGGLLL